MKKTKFAICLFLTFCISMFIPTLNANATPVDLELALLVDVSASIDSSEFALQRQGYVDAFRNTSIISAIENSALGSIAASLVYWSTNQVLSVGWTQISDATTSNNFADAIAAAIRPFSDNTGIGDALDYGASLFGNNGYEGTRLVIDISGDGVNNTGQPAATGRGIALGAGIDTINGLVIGTDAAVLSEYTNNVIGGTDAFVVQVNDFADFGAAIDEKILREVTVPEPATMLLLGSGLIGLAGFRRKKNLKK